MAQSEINVISHLIEVEQKASELLKNAQNSANEKLAQSRAKANSEFNLQYENLIRGLEKNYNSEIEEIKVEYKNKLDNFINDIEKIPQNKIEFSKVLKSILEK